MSFRRKVMANCGHETINIVTMTAFGESRKIMIKFIEEKTDYCGNCLEKMTIRCACCGKPIFIGDQVTLLSLTDRNHKMPNYAVLHSKKDNLYVCCLRINCTGAMGVTGIWCPPGQFV